MAEQALRRIAALYAIEKQIRGRPSRMRRQVRHGRAGPWLDELHAWLTQTLKGVSTRSNLAKAISYLLVRWTALTRYRNDGRIEIGNKASWEVVSCAGDCSVHRRRA